MKAPLIFQTIETHGRFLGAGSTHSFFQESDKDEMSVTSQIEDHIVDWIFRDKTRTGIFMENLYASEFGELQYDFRLKDEFLSKDEQKKIGDIDMIICPKNRPRYSTVIEFKRVKIETMDDQSDKVNKFENCRVKGLSQIDELRTFNFWKTYIGVIIEDDARNARTANTVTRSTNGNFVKAIYNLTFDGKLDEFWNMC